jgi:hypothetical protein
MFPEALVCPVFIVLCHEVPEASADELGKEPRRIAYRPEPRALGCGHKRQPFALTAPDKAPSLSLLKEYQQACGVGEVIRHDVPECGCFSSLAF